ncbi:MAG: MBL fold metallo-hydrolase [Clostridia bacterium]|nr:MBL fold metallo-hydrolase [Clostridia bacterium]
MAIMITDVRCQKGDASFLLDDGKTSILYDTGFGFTGYAIAENIKKVLGDRELDYIFLTHSHYDHALGSPYILRRYPTAKVVAGRYAEGVFKRDGAKRVMKELDAKYAEKCGVSDYEFLGDELKVDIAVDDGDIIQAGDMEFKVLNLPGHTRCSVGYYCEKEGLFLSCESIGVYDGEDTILPSYLIGYGASIDSIERVEKLNISSMVIPHFGLLDDKQTQFFLKNMKTAAQGLAQELLVSIKKGYTDEEIIEQFKDKYWHGYIKEISPIDAFKLNASITLQLIRNELL